MMRCSWVPVGNKLYEHYHDTEWGMPVHEDRKHFEFLVLESAQAGLSWETILKRREGYRKAFAGFIPELVAQFKEKEIQNLLLDEGIIRNRRKIDAAVNNAKRFIEITQEFGRFDKYIWQFVGGQTIHNAWKNNNQVPVFSSESESLSRDLKRRGFSFVGPTIIYAHMQACGLVNDHTIDCFRYHEVGT